MTILITGSGGQVGWELLRACRRQDLDAVGLTHGQLDITDPDSVARAFSRFAPAVVINATAYTAVDGAETEPDAAFAVNRDGAENLARAYRRGEIPLVRLSTDYVFDGEADRPYREDDAAAPVNRYGESKLQGESAVRAALPRHVILRVSWVFGVHGENFVKTMLSLAGRHDRLRIISDRTGHPTSAASITGAALSIARRVRAGETVPWGTYHFCGQPETSWYGFARTIFRHAVDLSLLPSVGTVEPIPGAEYPQPAARPRRLALDCSRWRQGFDHPLPDWETDLRRVLIELRDGEAGER